MVAHEGGLRATRRGFLLGLGALMAAPAVVKVSSIMPVRVPFDQRWTWSVYGAESARLNTYVSALRAPTANSDVNAAYPFADWPAAAPHVRLDRGEALSGVDLQRYEALNLPRVELLRIGDRVVDKRIVGGVAQILPKTVRATSDDDVTLPATAHEAWARDLANTVPVVGPSGTWDTLLSRAEIEARHQHSVRARRQAADVLARHAQWVGR